MLYIHTTAPENCIMKVDYWFNRHKENSWFNTGLISNVAESFSFTGVVACMLISTSRLNFRVLIL